MAVYVRAEALEVPAPSLSECSDSTIPDPDQIFPHRKGALGMIDNVLSQMFDDCWHELAKKETEKGSYPTHHIGKPDIGIPLIGEIKIILREIIKFGNTQMCFKFGIRSWCRPVNVRLDEALSPIKVGAARSVLIRFDCFDII